VLAYCTRTLIVDSGASAFGDYLSQRSCQILETPDFINQSKPFTSFNPRFQGCQHAFGPDCWFHPCPPGSDVSPLVEPFPALPRVGIPLFCLSRFHLPASLGSTGITPLPCYYGGSVTSRVQFFGPSTDHERCSFPGSSSLIHIAPTSDHSISNHPMHSHLTAHCAFQG
jgi:hypothetical protein